MGISLNDLDKISMGTVYDMLTERQNDNYDYPIIANQNDIDNL